MWDKVLSLIKSKHNETVFETWFADLQIKSIDENLNIINLSCKHDPAVKMLTNKYLTLLEDTIFEVFGKKYSVNVRTLSYYQELEKNKKTRKPKIEGAEIELNPLQNFENFVVGDNNSLAHAAAFAVSESPSQMYNPLFLYGGSGLGKTHLMNAIGTYIIKNNPSLSVLYVTSEMFTNEFVDSLKNSNTNRFKNKYRKVDVLLIDDIQFLEGKIQTQEEFFHTFNALFQENKQIVITGDRPPKDLTVLDERLRTRFAYNLVADLQPAKFETRVAILKKKIEISGLSWNSDIEEVCFLIAEKVTDNVRSLEGTIQRLISFSNVLDEKINLDLAKRVLPDILEGNEKTITPERIRSIVAKFYKIKVSEMDSKKRNAEIVLPRQVAMLLCRKNTDLSFQNIGKLFGGKNYSTVIASINKIEDSMRKDKNLKEEIRQIEEKIKANKS